MPEVLDLVPDFIRSGTGLILQGDLAPATNVFKVGSEQDSDIELESDEQNVLHIVQKVVLFLEDQGFFQF